MALFHCRRSKIAALLDPFILVQWLITEEEPHLQLDIFSRSAIDNGALGGQPQHLLTGTGAVAGINWKMGQNHEGTIIMTGNLNRSKTL